MANVQRVPLCAVYVRSSFTDRTCEIQLRDIHDFIKTRGWSLYCDYVDLASPGSGKGRHLLAQLLEDATKRLFSCVVVSKVDRFASSVDMLYRRLQFLESHGVRFVAAAQSLDTQDETPVQGGEMLVRVGRACLEFESLRSR